MDVNPCLLIWSLLLKLFLKNLVEAPAGNHYFQDSDWYVVGYYRTPGSVECDAQIEYNVE